MYLFGDDIVKARITRTGDKAIGNLVFANGLLATLVFTQAYKFQMYAETKKEVVPLNVGEEEAEPGKAYTDMVEMFRTGKEPRSHESILKGVAVLEALERSVESQEWENVSV